MTKAGKFKCTIEEYNNYPAARSSLLKLFNNKSPAHYLHALENPKASTPAQLFGTAVHEAMLEPKLFKEKMIVMPIFEGKTKDGKITTNANATEVKEKAAKWLMENHGKTIITEEERFNLEGMLASISKHKRASELLSDGNSEESLFWTDPETGIQCKARPDRLREGHIIADVKTTEDASEWSFNKDIAKFGYHFQGAMQLDAATAVFDKIFDTFIIIAVEKQAPWGVQCFQLSENDLREGQELYYSALRKLKVCLDTKSFPAYGNGLVPTRLPAYAIRREE